MVKYSELRRTLKQHYLSWQDVDQILLHEDTYHELMEVSGSLKSSNHETNDFPAVRITEKKEQIVYVDENGYEERIDL